MAAQIMDISSSLIWILYHMVFILIVNVSSCKVKHQRGNIMNTTRRLFWLLTISSFLLLTSGCSSTHLRTVSAEMARDGTGLYKSSGQKIIGYQLHGGNQKSFDGWAKVSNQDSLSFWSINIVHESSLTESDIEDNAQDLIPVDGPVFAITEVNTLNVVEPNGTKTVFAVILLPVAFVAVVVVIAVIADGIGPNSYSL